MRKAKELIGKAIVHQQSGERLASVYDIILDDEGRRIIALLIETGGWFRDARVIPWSRVASVSDVILVQGDAPAILKASESEVADQIKQDVRISGTPVMTEAGERVGTAGDLFIDDGGAIVGYEVKQGFISLAGRTFLPVDQVQAVGKDAIIVRGDDLPAD